MKIELQKIDKNDKGVIENLLQFYLYDYSDTNKKDINKWGTFEYEYLDTYFEDDLNRMLFFIKLNNIIVGFVMINDFSVLDDGKKVKSISEFFVMKKYRRIGIGSATVREIFKKYPGRWEIRVDKNNKVGLKFWRKNIKLFKKENYKEVKVNKNGTDLYVERFVV